jgi:predicted Zn-dependent protease
MQHSLQTEWEGYYLDGRTAARQRATVRLLPHGLEIRTASGASFWWPYAEIRQTQGFYTGQQVRLERGGEEAECLLVEDAAYLTALHRVAPQLTAHLHNPATRRRRLALAAVTVVVALGLVVTFYVWGLPAVVTLVAARIPVAWEEQLGRTAVAHIAPSAKQCVDAERAQIIERILTRLIEPLPRVPYTFRVIVVNDATVNALAAPGGSIVLFRGLLEHTRTAEELAGVLAHEMQHILHHHGTRLLLQHASVHILLSALAGDAGGALVFGLESAHLLGTLHHSRRHEQEADAAGWRMLNAAAIDPAGMLAFFALLQQQRPDAPGVWQYLSTHPRTAERLARLRELARVSAPQYVKLLPEYNWHDMHAMCQATR